MTNVLCVANYDVIIYVLSILSIHQIYYTPSILSKLAIFQTYNFIHISVKYVIHILHCYYTFFNEI